MIRRTAILFWFGRNAKPLRRETTAWRKAVMSKNGGRCVISGAATGNEAAHIFNVQKFPFFAYSVWNGVPLRALGVSALVTLLCVVVNYVAPHKALELLFALVVIITMIAAITFDPRPCWERLQEPQTKEPRLDGQ